MDIKKTGMMGALTAVAAAVIIFWGVRSLAFILAPLAMAMVITIAILPLPGWFTKKGVKPGLALILTILAVVGVSGPGCFHHHRVHRQVGRVPAHLCRQLVDADLGGRTILDGVGIRAGGADRGISAGHGDFGYPGLHGGDVNCKQRSGQISGGAESFDPVVNGQPFADEWD